MNQAVGIEARTAALNRPLKDAPEEARYVQRIKNAADHQTSKVPAKVIVNCIPSDIGAGLLAAIKQIREDSPINCNADRTVANASRKCVGLLIGG